MFAYISLVLTQTDIDITEWVVPHRNETHNNVEHVGGICDVRHIPHLKDTAWSDVMYNRTNMCMVLWSTYQWLSARLWYLQFVSNGDTTALH